MNQTQALARLRKVIGPQLGYRIDPKALLADERAEALIKARDVREQRNATEVAMNARRAEVLRDPLYQELRAKYEALRKEHVSLNYYSHQQRITVGVDRGMFFSVRAEGDNWAEVVAKVTQKEAA